MQVKCDAAFDAEVHCEFPHTYLKDVFHPALACHLLLISSATLRLVNIVRQIVSCHFIDWFFIHLMATEKAKVKYVYSSTTLLDPYSCKVCCFLKLAVDPTWRYASGNFSTVCRPILAVVSHNASQALEFGNFSAPHRKDLILPLTRVEMRANFGAYADVVKELHYAIASNEVVNSPNPKGLSVLFLDDVTPCPNGRCKRGRCFKLIGPKDASFGGIVDLLGGESLCKQANIQSFALLLYIIFCYYFNRVMCHLLRQNSLIFIKIPFLQ